MAARTACAVLCQHEGVRVRLFVLILVCASAWFFSGASCRERASAPELAFRNAVDSPPAGYDGPLFALSRDYPAEAPPRCDPKTVCRWLDVPVDFSASTPPEWNEFAPYLSAVLAYVREGNDLSAKGWSTEVSGETRWFHVPWMAYDAFRGREFAHGMTNERTATYQDFVGDPPAGQGASPPWSQQFETWAVGMYNPWGGFQIGQAIDRQGVPADPGDGLSFPEGTLATKLLFTSATEDTGLPFLAGAPSWTVNRHIEVGGCDRGLAAVQLVQVDVAVVDERSPSHWVYGTFAYDGRIETEDPWDRLVPVGLMWGNDPNVWPGNPDQQQGEIVQSVLAPDPAKFYEHFGCAPLSARRRRLAGPVDNRASACIACHQTAYVGPVGKLPKADALPGAGALPSLFPDGLCTIADRANRDYFSNLRPRAPYPGFAGLSSLDTSLQLRVAYLSYAAYAEKGRPQDKCSKSRRSP